MNLVASLVPAQLLGTAFGWYHCAIGLAALPASVAFGLLCQQWDAAVAFSVGAVLTAHRCDAAARPPRSRF